MVRKLGNLVAAILFLGWGHLFTTYSLCLMAETMRHNSIVSAAERGQLQWSSAYEITKNEYKRIYFQMKEVFK